MAKKIYLNPRTKQRKLNVTTFKDEWVYQAHESSENLPHMIEYIQADNYNKAMAAMKTIGQSSTDDAETLKQFCRDIINELNN